MANKTLPQLPTSPLPLVGTEIVETVVGGDSVSVTAQQIAQIAIGTVSLPTLSGWAYVQSFQVVSATRDVNGAIVTASIVWPDGVTGVFTTDVASVAFPGAVDAWHATYVGSPSRLITQPTVTRDANGAVTVQPAITIV